MEGGIIAANIHPFIWVHTWSCEWCVRSHCIVQTCPSRDLSCELIWPLWPTEIIITNVVIRHYLPIACLAEGSSKIRLTIVIAFQIHHDLGIRWSSLFRRLHFSSNIHTMMSLCPSDMLHKPNPKATLTPTHNMTWQHTCWTARVLSISSNDSSGQL